MLLLRDGVGWRDKYAACGDPGMAYAAWPRQPAARDH